ncbi:NAD kinase [Seramator thermalis]|uniref:NAD kinase n=1 Tax=Seramator thermalis TaxID=2496270 RepID=UPI001EEE29C8|nr:NAD kinase [Seramator thermalis]
MRNTTMENLKFALFGSTFPDRTYKAEEQIAAACEAISRLGGALYLPDNFFYSLSTPIQNKIRPLALLFDVMPPVDMVVSVGGDGTFLRTAATVGDQGIPVLGINTGRLGFLAAINFQDMDATLLEIFQNRFDVEDRTLLEISTDDEDIPQGFNIHALNEVSILRQDTASMLSIKASINGEYLTSYQADGLVIATPTGSTAYSLSIGGSILAPTTPSFILTAIAPHNLTSRPLVVDDNSRISLQVTSRSRTFLLSLDGQTRVFDQHTKLDVYKAPYTLKVVRRAGHTFFETLRDKLMWGADVRRQ